MVRALYKALVRDLGTCKCNANRGASYVILCLEY